MITKKIILQGLLFDDKSSFMRGAAAAPAAIRTILNNGAGNFFNESGINLADHPYEDKGDFSIADYFAIEEVTAFVDAVLVPHGFSAVTSIFPLSPSFPEVTDIETVPSPESITQFVGTVQLYVVALATASIL